MKLLFFTLGILVMCNLSAQFVADKLKLIPPKNGIYVIAHRGAHQGIPENTLAAYQHAIDLGCDFVEIDVRTTKDGRFVSVHNASIDRYVEGVKGNVRDLTLEEIKRLDLGTQFGKQWEGTQIPTLDEILELCQGKIGIYLDLKEAPIPSLVDLIKKFGMVDQVVWYIEATHPALMELYQVCPECLSMPDAGNSEYIGKVVRKFQNKFIATDVSQLNIGFADSANIHHLLIFSDDEAETEAEWTTMLSLGVDGIQTDKPEALIQYLKRKYTNGLTP